MVDLLGERERGKAKEIQHKSDRSRREREGTARARLVQSTSCRFGFVQQPAVNPAVASSSSIRGGSFPVRKRNNGVNTPERFGTALRKPRFSRDFREDLHC